MPHRTLRFCLSLLLCGLLCGAALAQPLPEQIGHLVKLSGRAEFEWRGRSDTAHLGQAIVVGMSLRTGADGTLAIILDDGTVMALGPRSEMTLQQYRFDPAGERFRLDAGISRGTLSFTSGAMARLDPEAVTLSTPAGSVRVYQAHLLLKVTP